jgi:glutamate synthase domain-containing protein 3
VNAQLVEARRPESAQLARLHRLLVRHVELTGSVLGQALLDDWDVRSGGFWRIAPMGELARVEAVHEGSVAAPA